MEHRLSYLGCSDDGRTGRWAIYCQQRRWEPRTTMFSKQILDCKHCGKELAVNYNDRTIEVVE